MANNIRNLQTILEVGFEKIVKALRLIHAFPEIAWQKQRKTVRLTSAYVEVAWRYPAGVFVSNVCLENNTTGIHAYDCNFEDGASDISVRGVAMEKP